MAFIKFRADQLFDGYHLLDDQHVLIISEEGMVEDIVIADEAGDGVQMLSGILTPGFINCHCHLELSHMKGSIPEKTGLIKFVSQVMKDRHFAETEILQAIDEAEGEMLQSGIVAVGDICNNEFTIPQKTKGRIWYHNFIEASGLLPHIAEQRFEKAKDIYRAFSNKLAGGLSYPPSELVPQRREVGGFNSIVPHAPYSVSEELWEKIINFPANQLMTIHNQETEDENNLFLNKQGEFLKFYETFNLDPSFFQSSGKTSLQTYLSKFLPDQQVILVHNVHTLDEDLSYCQQSSYCGQLYWCFCPNANLYIAGQLPHIESFIKQDCTIVLGTDSLASNHQLSITAEMKTIREHFPSIETEQLLRWATINGARALQMDNIAGSFEKGKKPGVVLCDATFSESKRLL